MRIYPLNTIKYENKNINNNNNSANLHNCRQNFGASHKEIMGLFGNSGIMPAIKKSLYELTDIPYFSEAIKFTPVEDVLNLANMHKNAQTNILELALKGDITAGIAEDGFMQKIKYLDLPFIAHHSAKAKSPNLQINLYQAMQNMPVTVEQLEYDAIRMYGKANMFPPFITYIAKELPCEKHGQFPEHEPINIYEAIFQQITGKNSLDNRDMIIKFEKTVTSPYGVRINYKPVPKNMIEAPIVGLTSNLRQAFANNALEKADKIALFELTDIPYFTNLAKETDPLKLGAFARINRESDDLFGKMFRKEIPMVVYNTSSEEPQRIPFVDIESLVFEKQKGIIESKDLVEILDNNTFAMKVYKMQKAFKKEIQNVTLTKMDFDSDGQHLETRFHVIDEYGDEGVFAQMRTVEDPDANPIIGALEFFPKKMFSVEFEPPSTNI